MNCAHNCKVWFCNQGRNCPNPRTYPPLWWKCMFAVAICALIVIAGTL